MALRTIFACLMVALLACRAAGAGEEWKYVVPPPDDPFAHPPLRALALTDRRPADLKESVAYRGRQQRYAQLVYGVGRTANVAVVADIVGPNDIDLYVDANRDRDITAEDRIKEANGSWRVTLKTVFREDPGGRKFPRTVVFRYGRATRTLSVATCGYVEGRVDLNGKTVTVRRVDGDANGLFADAQDRIWIDRNGDGIWDSSCEEFLFAPILRLDDQRIAVRADAWGEQLSCARLEGTAKLRLRLPAAIKPEQVEEIQATVQSRDGVVANLRGFETALTVPTGNYRVSSLLLTLKDPKGGISWGFVFNDNGGKEPCWHALAKDVEVALDPVGSLDFAMDAGEGRTSCRAGAKLSIRPTLYTGDGLLIERAYRGAQANDFHNSGCGGQIALLGADEKVLDSAHSGFA